MMGAAREEVRGGPWGDSCAFFKLFNFFLHQKFFFQTIFFSFEFGDFFGGFQAVVLGRNFSSSEIF